MALSSKAYISLAELCPLGKAGTCQEVVQSVSGKISLHNGPQYHTFVVRYNY